MAKINFGNVVADARGKLGGIVLSKNKSGAYVRTKVTPSNPRTAPQQTVRANFGGLAQLWSEALTDSQRSGWVAFAQTYPRRNIFGNALVLNGLNTLVAYNMVLLQMAQAVITDAPASPAVSPATWDNTWGTLTTASLIITEPGPSGTPGAYNYVFATRSLPPGRAPKPSDYRWVFSNTDLTSPGPVDISGEYIARFGAPTAGLKVYALIATADSNTGALSVSQPISGTVS